MIHLLMLTIIHVQNYMMKVLRHVDNLILKNFRLLPYVVRVVEALVAKLNMRKYARMTINLLMLTTSHVPNCMMKALRHVDNLILTFSRLLPFVVHVVEALVANLNMRKYARMTILLSILLVKLARHCMTMLLSTVDNSILKNFRLISFVVHVVEVCRL